MTRDALKPFLIVSAVLLALTAANIWVLRPVPIPAPVSADSLAGVLARLFPGTDSSAVARIHWRESPELVLRWTSGEEYAYQGPQAAMVPIIGEADAATFTITLAKGQSGDAIVKHELAHLLVPGATPQHPAAIFQRLETYRGR